MSTPIYDETAFAHGFAPMPPPLCYRCVAEPICADSDTYGQQCLDDLSHAAEQARKAEHTSRLADDEWADLPSVGGAS